MQAPDNAQRRMRPVLGTFVEIGAPDTQVGTRAFDAGFAAIEDVHARLSFQDATSELSRLNRTCGEPVRMSSLALRVLRLALALQRASNERFNCTIGGALIRQQVLPDHGGPTPIDVGTHNDVRISGDRVELRRPVRLTLDGIAKGYAVDRAVQSMRAAGAEYGWVNAGGDLRVFGSVRLPVRRRELDGRLTMLGELHNAAAATSASSGSNDARFPGAIVSNATERAAGVWTVLAHRAWRADALTKVAALTNDEHRAGLVQRLGGRLITGSAH